MLAPNGGFWVYNGFDRRAEPGEETRNEKAKSEKSFTCVVADRNRPSADDGGRRQGQEGP